MRSHQNRLTKRNIHKLFICRLNFISWNSILKSVNLAKSEVDANVKAGIVIAVDDGHGDDYGSGAGFCGRRKQA